MGKLGKKRARKSAEKAENRSSKRRRCDGRENDETAKTSGVDKATEETSPLLRLPGELRNQIYGYLTINQRVFFYANPNGSRLSYQTGIVLPNSYRNLSQSNRQLRDEVSSYALHKGEFSIKYRSLEVLREHHFLTVNKVELTFVRSLEIDVTGKIGLQTYMAKAEDVAHYLSLLINKHNLKHVIVKGVYDRSAPGRPWQKCFNPDRLVYCLKRYLHLSTRRLVEVEADAQGWPSPEELYDFEGRLYKQLDEGHCKKFEQMKIGDGGGGGAWKDGDR